MELPKNITQIGEVDKNCKVYVEDYVVSYLKQLNQEAENRDISVALYGRHEREEDVDYYFVYGACRVEHLPKEVRHLSQAQLQEIERWRRKYFPELTFVGYHLLSGEMIEGFHICDQDICRYIAGYARFYEKNEAMLAYMLDVRESAPSERVDQEKYARVRRRQEERRAAASENADQAKESQRTRDDEGAALEVPVGRKILRFSTSDEKLQRMRLGAVGVFALLCLFGIATFREDTSGLPYPEDTQVVNASVVQEIDNKDTLIMEDKLEQAVLQENRANDDKMTSGEGSAEESTPENAEENAAGNALVQEQTETAETAEAVSAPAQTETDSTSAQTEIQGEGDAAETVAITTGTKIAETAETAATDSASVQTQTVEQTAATPEAVAYVIQPGDTLIAISRRQYGTDARVKDICARNKITDPNDIKKGQVIMLPR